MHTQSIVLVGVGELAQRTIALIPEFVVSNRIDDLGSIGVILSGSMLGAVHVSRSPIIGLSGWSVQSWLQTSEAILCLRDDDLAAAVVTLFRKLADDARHDPGSSRLRLWAYVIVDLTAHEAVHEACRVARTMRSADGGIDVTWLVATGRVADVNPSNRDQWLEDFRQLLMLAQDIDLLQRLYVLDGQSEANTWLQSIDDVARCAAEFIVYHASREHGPVLRKREQSRTIAAADVLSVCGSFATVSVEVTKDMLATRLVADLSMRSGQSSPYSVLTPTRRSEVDVEASTVLGKLHALCECGVLAACAEPDGSAARRELDDKIKAILKDGLMGPPW